MTKYKMVALDMDGTLLDERSEISRENEDWIRRALDQGIIVSFCTGRGVQGVDKYTQQLQLTTPLVTVNGSEVWMEPGHLHKRHLMDIHSIEQLRQLALQYDTWYWGYTVNGVFNKEGWADQPDQQQWLKFGYYTEDEYALRKVKEALPQLGHFEVTNSHPCNLEVNPAGVNKASGLRDVCAQFGFSMSEVVAVGDSLNDLAMIREAGLGVAMGNAQEAVKQAADWVTLTNSEDGVADVIQRKVLNTK